jgi:hypothetical protein
LFFALLGFCNSKLLLAGCLVEVTKVALRSVTQVVVFYVTTPFAVDKSIHIRVLVNKPATELS